jgi:hypothetical protein
MNLELESMEKVEQGQRFKGELKRTFLSPGKRSKSMEKRKQETNVVKAKHGQVWQK